MELRDYVEWHDQYEQPGSRLHLRLLVVRDLIEQALDELPAGPIRMISMCAGQGRDLITVARRHRRGHDLAGRLVELDPRNVAALRVGIERAGLGSLEVREGDAGTSDAYAGAAPANLVLACGIFGNITDADIHRTARFLPALCASGAWVVWTRHPRPPGMVETIQDWMAEAGLAPRALVVSEADQFGVGAACLEGEPQPFRPGVRLFDFTR